MSYSVLVNRVLNVRLVVRKALQYAMARYFVLSVLAIPVFVLIDYFYRGRNQTPAHLISRPSAIGLTAFLVQSGLTLWYRKPVLDAIGRRFFREQYDSRRILTALVDQSRATTNVAELGNLLAFQIDRALHPDKIGFFLREPQHDRFLDPSNRWPTLAAGGVGRIEVGREQSV